MPEEKKAISIEVPSKGDKPPSKEEEEEKMAEIKANKLDGSSKSPISKKFTKMIKINLFTFHKLYNFVFIFSKKVDDSEELSEEDRVLKEKLELQVERVQDSNEGVAELALVTLSSEIRSATSSMTSVPKPLKFLRPHYKTLVDYLNDCPHPSITKQLADVISG